MFGNVTNEQDSACREWSQGLLCLSIYIGFIVVPGFLNIDYI